MSPRIERLVNHSLHGSYPDRELELVTGVWGYATRPYVNTSRGHAIQFNPGLRPLFPWILRHYRNVGLEPTETVIWREDLAVASEYPDADWDVFLFSDLHHAVRPDPRRRDGTATANDKNRFVELCEQLGARVPFTARFDSKTHYRASPNGFAHGVYLRKKAVSAAGMGVEECHVPTSVAQAIASLEDGIPFQLQLKVGNVVGSFSAQFHAYNGNVQRIALTDQVVEGYSHEGNRFPCAFAETAWDQLDPVADAIVKLGVEGYFGFDVVVDQSGHMYLIECNPRPTAAIYYHFLANTLGVSHWRSMNTAIKARRLEDLDIDGLELNQATGSGLVIVCWGTVPFGKAGVFFGGKSHEECDGLYTEFLRRNGVH